MIFAQCVYPWAAWQRGHFQAHERSQAVGIEGEAPRIRESLVRLVQAERPGGLALSVEGPGECEADSQQLHVGSLARAGERRALQQRGHRRWGHTAAA